MNKWIYLLFVLVACNNSYHYETRVFEEYCLNTFEKELAKEPHLYMISSNYKCSGCVQKTFLFMEELCRGKSLSNVSIITSDLQLIPSSISAKAIVLLDSVALFDRLDIGVANVTLLRVEGEEVVMLKSVQLNEIEEEMTLFLTPFVQ